MVRTVWLAAVIFTMLVSGAGCKKQRDSYESETGMVQEGQMQGSTEAWESTETGSGQDERFSGGETESYDALEEKGPAVQGKTEMEYEGDEEYEEDEEVEGVKENEGNGEK